MAGGLAVLAAVMGCATVAQVTTLNDPACKSMVREQLNSVLLEQGEEPDLAKRLAVNTTTVLATGALGPRPFGVSSPSGADYSFFVQHKSSECLLRLYGRQKGFARYSNNLTYIASRSLDGCQCAD
jgi:hypothetical protein